MPGQAELNPFGTPSPEPCGHCEISVSSLCICATEDIRAAPKIPAAPQGWPGHLRMPAPLMLPPAQPCFPCLLPAPGRAL